MHNFFPLKFLSILFLSIFVVGAGLFSKVAWVEAKKVSTQPTTRISKHRPRKKNNLSKLEGLYQLDVLMMKKMMRKKIARLSKKRQRFALLALEMLERSKLEINVKQKGSALIQVRTSFMGRVHQRKWKGSWKKQGSYILIVSQPVQDERRSVEEKHPYRLRCKVVLKRLFCQDLGRRRRVHFVVKKAH